MLVLKLPDGSAMMGVGPTNCTPTPREAAPVSGTIAPARPRDERANGGDEFRGAGRFGHGGDLLAADAIDRKLPACSWS